MEYKLLPEGSGFNIHRLTGAAPTTCPAHSHDFYEIYFNLGEDMQYFIANQDYTIRRNDFAFIDCNVFHHTRYRPNSRIDRVNLYMSKETLARLFPGENAEIFKPLFDSRRITLPREAGQSFERALAQEVLPLFARRTVVSETRAYFKAIDILLDLAEMLQEGVVVPGDPDEGSHNRHIADIIAFVEEKYSEHLTLDDISSHLYLNKYYVSHLFSRSTGLSITDYILMRRIREAKQLLIYSRCSIIEIAFAVGYSNSNHFSKCFKQETQYSPREYREKFSPSEGLY